MSHLPPDSSRGITPSKAKIAADPDMLANVREMQMFEHTIQQYTPNVEVSRQLLVHSLDHHMKQNGLYDKITQVLHNPVLNKASDENYIAFTHQLMWYAQKK